MTDHSLSGVLFTAMCCVVVGLLSHTPGPSAAQDPVAPRCLKTPPFMMENAGAGCEYDQRLCLDAERLHIEDRAHCQTRANYLLEVAAAKHNQLYDLGLSTFSTGIINTCRTCFHDRYRHGGAGSWLECLEALERDIQDGAALGPPGHPL